MRFDYLPKFWKKRKMPWENTLAMGLELELEHKSCSNEINDVISSLHYIDGKLKKEIKKQLFYYIDEASLNNGAEFVTHPMTLQYIHNNINFKKVFEILKVNFKKGEKAGIHIHLNKNIFSKSELEKLKIFFSVNNREIFKFSERKKTANQFYYEYEEYNIHDFLKSEKKVLPGRYWACNFDTTNKKTIEIRVFNTTTDYKKLQAIFHFCDAVVYFIKDVSFITINSKKCWKEFILWCEKQNRYHPFLENIKK